MGRQDIKKPADMKKYQRVRGQVGQVGQVGLTGMGDVFLHSCDGIKGVARGFFEVL